MNEEVIVEFPSEHVQGDFFAPAGETQATREDDPGQQQLRWREGDRWYEIKEIVYPRRPGYLDREAQILLAESLVYAR